MDNEIYDWDKFGTKPIIPTNGISESSNSDVSKVETLSTNRVDTIAGSIIEASKGVIRRKLANVQIKVIGYVLANELDIINQNSNNKIELEILCKMLNEAFYRTIFFTNEYPYLSKFSDEIVLILKTKGNELIAYDLKSQNIVVGGFDYPRDKIFKFSRPYNNWFALGDDYISSITSFSTAYNTKVKDIDITNGYKDEFGVVYSNDLKRLLCCPRDIKKYDVLEGVITICSHAFAECEDLQELRLPSTLRQIGWHAFSKCRRLNNLILPNQLEYIDDDSFYYCESLESLNIPETVIFIGSYAFCGCHNLKDIKLPTNLRGALSMSTFSECLSLSKILLPDGITDIYSDAFERCERLKDIKLPNSLVYISDKAFQNCNNIESISFPATLKIIEDRSFRYCRQLKRISFGGLPQKIGDRAFLGCSIYTIQIPQGTYDSFKKILPHYLKNCNIVEI